jgi:hypothetical protein
MNEIGLDPGVDHMSAMKVIDEISDKGGKMLLFESFVGVLLHQNQIPIVINSLGLPVCSACWAGGQLNLFKKERTSIYPIAIYLEEHFLKWKIMVALRLILTGIH